MGAQLVAIYDRVSKEFGLMGRVKLAMLTKTTSENAKSSTDSPELIKVFEQAITQIKQTGGK